MFWKKNNRKVFKYEGYTAKSRYEKGFDKNYINKLEYAYDWGWCDDVGDMIVGQNIDNLRKIIIGLLKKKKKITDLYNESKVQFKDCNDKLKRVESVLDSIIDNKRSQKITKEELEDNEYTDKINNILQRIEDEELTKDLILDINKVINDSYDEFDIEDKKLFVKALNEKYSCHKYLAGFSCPNDKQDCTEYCQAYKGFRIIGGKVVLPYCNVTKSAIDLTE